jgi:hypothetical protein
MPRKVESVVGSVLGEGLERVWLKEKIRTKKEVESEDEE